MSRAFLPLGMTLYTIFCKSVVVVPCPKTHLGFVSECFDVLCMLVLLISGDVQLDPGQNGGAVQVFHEGQNEVLEKIESNDNNLEDYRAQTERKINSNA